MNSSNGSTHFEKTEKFLQITFDPESYNSIIHQHRGRIFSNSLVNEYWKRLPIYLISRCPLCHATYTSSLDTHGLSEWARIDISEKYVFTSYHQQINCKHFVAVNTFINLNNHIPIEEPYFASPNTDVPYITPEMFEMGQTYAVMHSLPICRLAEDEFTPTYSLFTIVYYSEEPSLVYDHVVEQKYSSKQLNNDEYSPVPIFSPRSRTYERTFLYDLMYWVRESKLCWLDLDEPDLPLKSDTPEEFPYANIQGFGCEYIYRRRPRPDWWWQRRNWHPDGEIRDSHGRLLAKPDW